MIHIDGVFYSIFNTILHLAPLFDMSFVTGTATANIAIEKSKIMLQNCI